MCRLVFDARPRGPRRVATDSEHAFVRAMLPISGMFGSEDNYITSDSHVHGAVI